MSKSDEPASLSRDSDILAPMTTKAPDLDALVRDFTARLVEAVEAQVRERVLAAAARAFALPTANRSATSLKGGVEGGAAPKTGRTLKLTAKGLAIRKLQGQYLGVLRGLAPTARERVKAVAKRKGVAAAVAFAESLK